MKRGGDGYCCGRVVVGGFVFLKLSCMYRCYFAWVVVVACLALSLSTVRYLSLSLPNYTDVPNADSSGTSYSSNIHTTSRRVNV